MTTQTLDSRARLGRTLGLGMALSLALLANLGDRAFSAGAANSGIDPLEILNTGVKNNILFVVDTSGSMAGTPQDQNAIVGGDDPASRFYQTKRAVREVITANARKANFGLATFHPEFVEHRIDGNQGLVYVTQDPTGNLYRNNFPGGSVTLTDSCAAGTSCTATESTAIYTNLRSNDGGTSAAYPQGCTPQTQNQVEPNGTVNGPIPHTLGSPATSAQYAANNAINAGLDCRYYMKSKLMIHGKRYGVVRGAASASAIVSSANITCPAPPPGLLGDDVLAYADGSKPRACFQLQDRTVNSAVMTARSSVFSTSSATTYSGTNWTPAADSLLIAFVVGGTTAGSAVDPTSVVGHGVTYTKLNLSANLIPAASSTHAVSVWIAKAPASPTSAAAVATFASSQAGGAVVEYEVTGADVSTISSTPSSANAIVQAVTTIGNSGTATTTLAAASNAANSVMYFATHLGNTASAPAGGWTEGADGSFNNPATGVQVQHRQTFTTAASATFTSAAWRGVALEIKALPPTNTITTYWVTGTNFDFVHVNGASTSNCEQSGINVDVADCGVDNSEQINSYMRMELQYDQAGGTPRDVPALTSLSNRKPNINETPAFSLDVTPPIDPPFLNPGIRQGNGTPLAASMTFALNYFTNATNGILKHDSSSTGTLKRPWNAIGKQRQFVILLSDGDESCGGAAPQAAYNLWSNTAPALPACTGTCLTNRGITAKQWAVANRIEVITITFAGGSAANVDAISRAGTGRNPANSTCTLMYPGVAGATELAPCRTAYIANNLDELVNALNNAINASTETGEFSDQQSVTETVFEFGAYATPPVDPFDPAERYAASIPILLQSTFELPGYKGHLNAFRRNDMGTTDPTDDQPAEMWDGGLKLQNRLLNTTYGMGAQPGTNCTAPGAGCYTFAQLYGSATNTNPVAVAGTTAKIKRRIFTTTQNGVNGLYNPTNLLANSSTLAWTRVPLWPPTTGAASNSFVAPTATGSGASPVKGILDTAMGLDSLNTVAEVQAAVTGPCQGTVPGDIHPDCSSATAGVPLARAKREAREIILAYIAGAQIQAENGVPVRASSSDELLYVIRPWVMVESTLAAPGVVTPPLLAGPKAGGLGFEEYKHYRDGVKQSTGAPVATTPSQVVRGLGLRNPDRLEDSVSQAIKDAAFTNLELKPSMSVVYHATNQGLHALRAGPCPTPSSSSGLGGTSVDCQNTLDGAARETGGEELWSFVPYDVLSKLPALTKLQSRSNKQYLLAAPVRFTDVFVPGGASYGGVSFTGVWRTLLYFGRGQGGKYLTALDITAPGPFTRLSVKTEAPIVVWSRGNPDTSNGLPTGSPGAALNYSAADYAAYLKMGETWSVPSIGYVTAADYGTTRKLSGTDFVMFAGSGYSDVAGEGKTFFVLDALNGDVVRTFDIADGTPAAPPIAVPPAPQDPPLTNFLVAPTVYYAEEAPTPPATVGRSPSGLRFIGNPITAKVKTVYFGDLHSRIWRYDATDPSTPPALFFQAPTGTDGNQPFATAVSIIADDDIPGDVLVYAEAGHDRRVTPQAARPFKAYAWRDSGGVKTDIFTQDFPTGYRGTVQPATAFAQSGSNPPAPVVFYAGVRFTTACVSTFDSILYALKGLSATTTPEAAFDLQTATGDDAFIEIQGNKINAIRVSGEGNLVIDRGLYAENPPPPPGTPVQSELVSTSSSLVSIGLVPGSQAYKDLSATTVPLRVGSSVCRTEP